MSGNGLLSVLSGDAMRLQLHKAGTHKNCQKEVPSIILEHDWTTDNTGDPDPAFGASSEYTWILKISKDPTHMIAQCGTWFHSWLERNMKMIAQMDYHGTTMDHRMYMNNTGSSNTTWYSFTRFHFKWARWNWDTWVKIEGKNGLGGQFSRLASLSKFAKQIAIIYYWLSS